MEQKEKDRKESYNQPISIKLTRSEKKIWDNNKGIAEEIRKMVRNYIDYYITEKE